MKVDPKTAPRAEYKGKSYVFCSESDRQKFVADPEQYLKSIK
jgi:YHS domain-containing protein